MLSSLPSFFLPFPLLPQPNEHSQTSISPSPAWHPSSSLYQLPWSSHWFTVSLPFPPSKLKLTFLLPTPPLLSFSLFPPDNPNDPISQLLAILTLSPMLVIPAYLAVFVFERQATILSMLAGQVSSSFPPPSLHLQPRRPTRAHETQPFLPYSLSMRF